MENFLKIKKGKSFIFLLLFFNQFLFNGFAASYNELDLGESEKNNLQSKFHKRFKILLAEKNKNETNTIIQEANRIEEFLEETFDPNEFEIFKNKKNEDYFIKNNIDELEIQSSNKDIEKNKSTKDKKKNIDKLKKNKLINKLKNIKQKKRIRNLPLPSRSTISSSEFKVPSRGYVNLKGPKITINLEQADPIEILKTIGKLANYGIVIIEKNNSLKEEGLSSSKITANFDKIDISDVFNSILLSANLQAVEENNIIYVGKNVLNKSLIPKISKTYRLNQVNAASVADYLSTLGAKISKVRVVSGSTPGIDVGDALVNKKEFKDELINSYGIEGGPLFGLIGTADLRLQTITLIGSRKLIKTAEKYIKSLDVRHRQVALTIKIIDVSLTKSDLKNNLLELRSGNTEVINNGGLSLATGNFRFGANNNSNIQNVITDGVSPGNFINWLEAKITNENAKVLASPTLILGENPNILTSGAASAGDGLSAATIGRPFKNEGFIKVGETVITGFSQTNTDGVVTCTATEGTAGITFGAKVDKIDDNGYVSFALSPAISSVTKSVEISGCGIQNTLSVRKLDTGSIRVKNGDTLILTGVLQDSDTVSTSKVPILGDIPILGSLFRSNATQKRKSELIILVTPKILKDK